MLKLLSAFVLAATVLVAPSASFGFDASKPAQTERAATAPALPAGASHATKTPATQAEFDLDVAHEHEHSSGLAPGQGAQEFRAWLGESPANRAKLAAFRAHLAAEGVAGVVPLWQLVRTSSSWRDCGAEPFEAPPADKWDHIITTLKFVRDKVEPAVGDVEPLSVYRNEKLNACSDGAPKSAHRELFALDLTPVDPSVERADMIRSVCAAHARDGEDYDAGLGFYSGKRFHVDSSGYRKWGANGKGASSPCVGQA
jgi:hypothetical protein